MLLSSCTCNSFSHKHTHTHIRACTFSQTSNWNCQERFANLLPHFDFLILYLWIVVVAIVVVVIIDTVVAFVVVVLRWVFAISSISNKSLRFLIAFKRFSPCAGYITSFCYRVCRWWPTVGRFFFGVVQCHDDGGTCTPCTPMSMASSLVEWLTDWLIENISDKRDCAPIPCRIRRRWTRYPINANMFWRFHSISFHVGSCG